MRRTLLLLAAFTLLAAPADAAMLLRQSTATTITMGPFLDEDDGKTPETLLTITQPDVLLAKVTLSFAQKSAASTSAHDTSGWYKVSLSTTDTNSLGPLIVMIHESGALPVWREFHVVPANVWNSLIGGTDLLDVQVGGMDSAVVTAAAVDTDAIGAAEIAADALGASEIATDAIGAAEIAADAITAAEIAANAIGASELATDAIGAAEIAADAITSSEIADGAITDAKVANDVQVDIISISTSAPAADNLETAALAYSATRGLAGTALPAAVADAAGGLPISDAGGLDLDTLLGTLTSLAAETRDANVLDQFKRTIAMVENLRPAHTGQAIGNIFFVDPTNGDTHANGNRGGITDPYDSLQDCHDNAVTDSNHDVVILLAGAAAGVTTLSETITLSKRYMFVRGPGRDFIVTRTGNGDTISVTADGIELSGFQLETAATGSGDGIQLTDADFLRVENVWINATQGDGINILRGDNCQIINCVFTDSGQGGSGQGIDIVGTAGDSNNNVIRHNMFRDTAGDAIQISGGTTNNTTICDNHIEGATAWGVDVTASSTDAMVCNNTFGNNSSGDINDLGTTSIVVNNEQWATETALTTVDGIVDAILVDTTAILIDTNELQTNQGNWLTATGFATETKQDSHMGATFSSATDSNEAIRNQGDTAWITATGFATEAKQDSAMGATFATGTDSQEAIRNRGDAAWTTGGSGTLTSATIAVAVWADDLIATREITGTPADGATAVGQDNLEELIESR